MDDNGRITDPLEIKSLMDSQEKITDINDFIKKSVKEMGPQLVTLQDGTTKLVTPDSFIEKFDKRAEVNKKALDEFLENVPEAISSKRNELIEVLEKYDSPLLEAFEKTTPEQKFVEIASSKISFAQGADAIDKVYAWAEIEMGKELSLNEKCLLIFAACLWLDVTETTYRGVRQIFLAATKDNEVEILPEFLIGTDKRDEIQRSVCAKLLKATTNAEIEDIFSWAEVKLGMTLSIQDKELVMFQVIEMIQFTDDIFKNIRRIFLKMNRTTSL